MAVDIRCVVSCSLGTPISGSVNDEYVQGTGLIKTTGSVVINQDKKLAHSEKADFTTADDKVVLTGNPRVESPDGTVSGRQITIWHGQEKMDVEADQTDTNRTRLIIFPEEQRKENNAQP